MAPPFLQNLPQMKRQNKRKEALKPSKTNARVSKSAKATRPLNSYIGFRSYYAKIFPELKQMDRSGVLSRFWEHDPFKAKWAILSKAYSVIRDRQGRDDSPLDDFLMIAAPFARIVPPSQYLNVLGWYLQHEIDGSVWLGVLSGTEISTSWSECNFSVNDVINHCMAKGFAKANVSSQDLLLSSNDEMMTLGTGEGNTSADQVQSSVAPTMPKQSLEEILQFLSNERAPVSGQEHDQAEMMAVQEYLPPVQEMVQEADSVGANTVPELSTDLVHTNGEDADKISEWEKDLDAALARSNLSVGPQQECEPLFWSPKVPSSPTVNDFSGLQTFMEIGDSEFNPRHGSLFDSYNISDMGFSSSIEMF